MTILSRAGFVVGAMLFMVPLISWAESDDSVLVARVRVAAANFRRTAADLEQLQSSFLVQHPDQNANENPQIQNFLQYTLAPTEMELRDLLNRYRLEYSGRAYRRLIKQLDLGDLSLTE